MTLRDSPPAVLHNSPPFARELIRFMTPELRQARWPEAIIITVALWLFVLLIFLPLIVERHAGEPFTSVALDSATILFSMLLATPLFAVFRATLRWPLAQRVAALIGTVMLIAVVNTIFDLLFQGFVADHIDRAWASLPANLSRAYPSALNYILVFGVNVALFQVSYARRAALKQELHLSRARSSAQQAQLAALRYQLNPHFLFNSLNSISALIVTRRNEDAEKMTHKLSGFLRTSLNADPGELIALDEELALTEEYLDIESVRFGDRLAVSVDCDPAACASLVPSFLVQPLVENAVKHGVAPSRRTVEVAIDATTNDGMVCIRVSNCLPDSGGEAAAGGSGVGLVNVRRRLEAVYGDRATLTVAPEGDRFVATICLPEMHSQPI